jgi:hypothetical protein
MGHILDLVALAWTYWLESESASPSRPACFRGFPLAWRRGRAKLQRIFRPPHGEKKMRRRLAMGEAQGAVGETTWGVKALLRGVSVETGTANADIISNNA